MANIKESLNEVNELDGFVGACIVDSDSGMMMGAIGGGGVINLELAAAGNTEVVRAKRKTMKALSISDSIQDILITLNTQYHIIRPLPQNDAIFVYVVIDKNRGNLALARHKLTSIATELKV